MVLRPRLVVSLVLAVGAAALGGCGSSGKPSATTGASGHGSFLDFSVCMRAHGVANFPDPSAGGGIHVTAGSGLDPQSPAFQRARQSCEHLLPGGGPPAQVPESVKQSALKEAECMRAHGLPNYPDPTFPKGGGIMQMMPPGLNPDSPAVQKAQKACASG